ncbi:MAG: D-alanyl-D-alanine carboxypeptidase/D-alanyl-D-alanine-endopeptidase [Muribaculaceae bacterium]|nr:D-alanyl-D-alanine carboxypeptidase/D-alanyl-D-alanine-endopeptidase [Muribaculaceae bacterium]
MNFNRSFLSLIAFLISVSAFAGVGDEAVAHFIKTNGIDPNSVSVKIIDLGDGSVVGAHNEESPLVPASIMKSVTTATLLESTGPDWRYHTRIYVDGPNDLGYLRGNVIVEGACDPTVNSDKEPFSDDIIEEIYSALSSQLVKRIEGNIIIDENSFAGDPQPASWAKEDRAKYYGTGSHAFNYADNSRGDFAVVNPSESFITLLKKKLISNGIDIEGNDMPEGRRVQILDHHSAPIDEIMRSCMMRSDNLFAESMLRTYGKLEGCDGSTEEATEKVRLFWQQKNLPLDGVEIIDGSGLSRANRVTANFMTELLKNMSDNPHYASFFPLAGQEGTLKKFLAGTPLDSYIAMKTGSMRGIQCYAGYKLDDDYMPTHVIVIIMNDITKSRDRAKRAAEQMLLSIFN